MRSWKAEPSTAGEFAESTPDRIGKAKAESGKVDIGETQLRGTGSIPER